MKPGRRAFVVVAVGLVSLAEPETPHACTCIVDKDATVEKKRDLQEAELVFEGTVLRIRVMRPATWTCEFDGSPLGDSGDGCLRIKAVSDACQALQGVKIVLDEPQARNRRSAFTPRSGTVEFCGLKPGKYLAEASAPKLGPIKREFVFERRQGLVLFSLAYEPDREFVTVFAVERKIKGTAPQRVEIRSGGICGFGPFETGKRYEVFASAEKAPEGGFFVHLCSGTRPLELRP
jgi:hypothetical protein